MKTLAVILMLATAAFAQSAKSNTSINAQIRELKVEKSVTLTFDAANNTSKIMVISPQWPDGVAKSAGVGAMNFGIAVFYGGNALAQAPEEIRLTFWVLSKKPRFAESHAWTSFVGTDTIDLGDARYAANKGENMEYLNFVVNRYDLARIAESEGKFTLGGVALQFTPEQLKLLSAIVKLTEV